MANTPYYSKAEADQKNKETFREVESTVQSISAGEGGILYNTLAEAQGLATKPSNGTIFQVSKITDPTNAGYYTFQSASTGGTRFEKDFVEPDGLAKAENLDFVRFKTSLVKGVNSDMSSSSTDWELQVGTPTFDINTTVLGKMYISFTSGVNQSIQIPNVLEIGKKYNIEVKLRLASGSANSILRIGKFTSANDDSNLRFVPKSTESLYSGTIIADNINLDIGMAGAENFGSAYEIDEIKIYKDELNLVDLNGDVKKFEDFGSIITGASSKMTQDSSNWKRGVGSLDFDIGIAVSDKMSLRLASGTNQSIVYKPENLNVGKTYEVRFKAALVSGSSMPIRIGAFASGAPSNQNFDITPTSQEQIFTGTITVESTTNQLSIGALDIDNLGSVITIDDFIVYEKGTVNLYGHEKRLTDVESSLGSPEIFITEQFFQSISKNDKALTKICVTGDSLMANSIGGAIPAEFAEAGEPYIPLRLRTNQIARRLYDLISWNKPTHIRLDGTEWAKNGAWDAGVTGFEGGTDTTFLNTQANSYVEITIPDGQENFALIAYKNEGFGSLSVTLNGGDISPYGLSSINLNRAKDSGSDLGNPYYTEVYEGLPTGINTIRITRDATTDPVRIWGGFYWTGNTLVVHNTAHGGHHLGELLDNHLKAEVLENDFDAVLFQLPLMNEAGHGDGVETAKANLQTIIEQIIPNKDICFMSCQPFGTDPTDGTPNYYTLYANPSMQEYNLALRSKIYQNKLPFVDVFSSFKKKIENRGGTLEGGEGGLFYTHDGQHQSVAGMEEYWNLIRFLFSNKPINY